MATGTIILPIASAFPSDGTTSNAPAQIARTKSTATAPAPHMVQANFDAATDEHLNWVFRMPADYASGLTLKLQYKMASATSGNVIMGCRMAAVSDGDATDVDAKAFATANTSGATAVPGTAGYLDEISITVSNADSVAAGDLVFFQVFRDADNASDTAANDLELVGVSLEYTTT